MILSNNVKIKIFTGDGGFASNYFYLKKKKKIYNGGNGGNGGSIFIICDKNILNFKPYFFYKTIKTKKGFYGRSFNKNGKNAKNIIIRVPLNTTIVDTIKNIILINFNYHKKIFLLMKGGIGGISFNHYKKSKNFLPTKGSKKIIKLKFNFNFFIVLIGIPNAGKSTFINTIFKKSININNYIFSTLFPNIFFFKKKFFLDTPGIIKNSLQGKGLGLNFLNFIKNTKILFQFIDLSLINYSFNLFYFNIKIINNELYKYDKIIFFKSRWFIFNKIDLLNINFKNTFLKKFLYFYNWYKKFFLLSSINKLNCISILKIFLYKYF